MSKTSIYTVGYGARSIEEFLALLEEWGIVFLLDVRSKPYSRYKPDFSKDALERHLKGKGFRYVFMGDTLGILGGYLVGTQRLGFNAAAYLKNTWDFLEAEDIVSSLTKAAVFGFIVALMGCYHGYNSGRGAQGVGRATINAVVSASVLILAANYMLTEVFFSS